MDWKKGWKPLAWIVGSFLACYYLPVGLPRFDKAVLESMCLVKWYAREQVLLCLIPAFYIAGAITVFVSQDAVMKYLGARANKVLAYGAASVAGTILAVRSCTVLPLLGDLPYGRGTGVRRDLSLFRPGHQRAGHHLRCAGAGIGARHRPGEEGLIPPDWISPSVGGNSITANFGASFVGAIRYFATLTEVPILQGLIGNGMGKGPALARLLAGPALSLPSMLVIHGILGTKKTVVFVTLIILMATWSGLLYGTFF